MPPAATPAAPPPAATQTAQPSPPEAVTPIEAPVSFDADIDADLAALDDETPKPPAPAPAAKPKAPAATKAKADEPPKEDDDDLGGGEEPTPNPAEVQEPAPKPVKAAALREAYEGLKKKVAEVYEPEVTKLRNEISELKSKTPAETAKLADQIKQISEERDALKKELAFQDFQKDEKFQKEYVQPYQEAWQTAMADISELKVVMDDGETRPGTDADLLKLANMPLGEATEYSKKLFGEASYYVMLHRKAIIDLAHKQQKALADAQKNALTHKEQAETQHKLERAGVVKAFKESVERWAEKYPNWFKPSEADPEGNKLLERGAALADLHFYGPQDLTPEQIDLLPPAFRDSINARKGLTRDEQIQLDALLRNKIASHSKLALRLKKAGARIKELEATIAQYESSEPGAGKGGRPGSSGDADPRTEAEAELDALDK